MNIITYNVKIQGKYEDSLIKTLSLQRDLVNFCSKLHFGAKKNSIVDLHNKAYKNARLKYPDAFSQLVIRAEQETLGSYRTAKSNKHNLKQPINKHNLSCRLDKRAYSKFTKQSIRISTIDGRKEFDLKLYPKIDNLFDRYTTADPLVFCKNDKLWLSVSFNIPEQVIAENKLAVGVDLGKRNLAVTSDGKLISGREFNKHKRRIRYNKRMLQSVGSKSSKHKLRKIRRKEYNFSKNYTHHVANEILDTGANIIVLEDLTKIKKKKNKYQNKNNISQVPFYLLRSILEYKAPLLNKKVTVINPKNTSKNDYRGIKPGIRKGGEYKTSDGLIFHADLNAANNIALKSKHPSLLVDPINSFRRQGAVKHPIVDSQISIANGEVYKPTALAVGV